MSIIALLIIALAATGAVVYLITYLPLVATIAGKTFSPRLLVCKILAPADAGITMFLVAGSWFGISSIVTGISMAVYNVLVGVGLSLGVVFVRKVLVPRWEERFEGETRSTSLVVTDGDKRILRPNA